MKFVSIIGILALCAATIHAESEDENEMPSGHPAMKAPHGAFPQSAPQPAVTGEIVETMDVGSYTYLQVRSADKTIWAAASKFEAKVGERVTVPGGMVMKNFTSPTLGRTFDEIYFTEVVLHEGEEAPGMPTGLPPGHPAIGKMDATKPTAPSAEVITQPKGALSIAAIHEQRTELAGKEVTVRGRVTSYTPRVMGLNWVHLVDGSGAGDSGELVLNTKSETKLDEIITARGVVAVDENLGHGYQYPVLLKEAALVGE